MHRSVEIRLEDDTVVNAVGAPELAIHPGDRCIVECRRIPEYGQVLRCGERDGALPPRGSVPFVLRRATLQDQTKAKENVTMGRMAAKTVRKRVEELKLLMRVVLVRYSFDRSVLHVAFTSEDRVEFGELIPLLAGELHTRIEMKPMGVRDAAQLVGGMGGCGRPLCCKTWLKEFDAVSVKMAKTQRLTLNPTTISGMCGRLKCCLKYEFEGYRSCGEKFPKDGARVACPDGCGRVCDKDIMRERVKIRLEDGRVFDYDVGEVSATAEPATTKGTRQEGRR